MLEEIDITCTATVRPDILDRTLYSFCNGFINRKADKYRFIMNVDPIGDTAYTQIDVVNVAKSYFDNVVINAPNKSNFARAFIWTWTQTRAPWVIHLEDDWQLLRDVEIDEMFWLFGEYEKLAILRLPFTDAEQERAKQWNKWFPFNGHFMECPREMIGGLAYSGHPSLIRGDWLRQVLPLLHVDGCPEKQIKHHNPLMNMILMQWRYGVFQRPHEKKAIIDIGREWRIKNNFEKVGAYGFTNWRTTK